MNANWFGLFCAATSVVVFFFTYRFLLAKPVSVRSVTTLVTGILSLPAASFAAYYLHWLPEPAEYYEFRSLSGIEAVLIALGLFGGSAATFFPGASRMLPLGAVLGFAFVPFLKPILGPLDLDRLTDLQRDGVTMQSLPSTCGAASSATVLRQFGFEVSEAEVAKKAYSYVNGTEAWYLARVIRNHGVAVTFRDDFDWKNAESFPVIVGVTISGVGHFIPLLGREGDAIIIGDPLRGREVLDPHVLGGRYLFSSWAMELTPPRQMTRLSQSPGAD